MLGLFQSLPFLLLKQAEFFFHYYGTPMYYFCREEGTLIHVLMNESESQSKLTLDHASLVLRFDTPPKKEKKI